MQFGALSDLQRAAEEDDCLDVVDVFHLSLEQDAARALAASPSVQEKRQCRLVLNVHDSCAVVIRPRSPNDFQLEQHGVEVQRLYHSVTVLYGQEIL